MSKEIGDANVKKDDEINNGTFFMEGDTGAGILTFRPDKMLDQLELRNSSGFVDTDNFKSAQRKDFLEAMDKVRGDTEMTEDDKEDYFKEVFIAYTSKFEGVSDMSRLKKTAVIKEFTDMGFEPPPVVSKREAMEETARLEDERLNLTLELREINKIIKNPTTTDEERTSKTREDLKKKNELALKQQEINRLTLASTQEVARFNMSDTGHKEHFDACFRKFMSKANVNTV